MFARDLFLAVFVSDILFECIFFDKKTPIYGGIGEMSAKIFQVAKKLITLVTWRSRINHKPRKKGCDLYPPKKAWKNLHQQPTQFSTW